MISNLKSSIEFKRESSLLSLQYNRGLSFEGDHLHNHCKVTFSCIFDQAQSRLLKRVLQMVGTAVCPTSYPIEEVKK